MLPLRNTDRSRLRALISLIFSLGLAGMPAALAGAPAKIVAPCAVIEDFGGRTQVLDSTRSLLLDTDVRTPLPCGAWVSTEDGWARLLHRDGYRILVGSNSFVELVETQAPDGGESEHLILYRGQIKVRAGSGTSAGEIRVLTPHARARVTRGDALILFSQTEQETQLIALRHAASFENRFEPSTRVRVAQGESSSLNFKAQRVAPSVPQAVALASLRQKLADLRLDDRAKGEALLVVKQRQERHFASMLAAAEGDEPRSPARNPAGLVFTQSEYRRHPPKKDDEKARDSWTKRLVGGVEAGEKILHPDRFFGRPSEVRVSVEVPGGERARRPSGRADDQERERLLRELSEIRVD